MRRAADIDVDALLGAESPAERERRRAEDIKRQVRRAGDAFFDRQGFRKLGDADETLITKLYRQINLYDAAVQSGPECHIVRHGEALLRGYEQATAAISGKLLDFNTAPVALCGAHPGPPPSRHGSQWKFWYARYRDSDAWKAKREHVIVRAHGRCEGCGECAPAEIHHLTYNHVGYEFLFELIALCRACHQRIHGRGERS